MERQSRVSTQTPGLEPSPMRDGGAGSVRSVGAECQKLCKRRCTCERLQDAIENVTASGKEKAGSSDLPRS